MPKPSLPAAAKPVICQRFAVPGCPPFVEIRTTLNSALPYAEHFHSSFSLGLVLAGRTCLSLGEVKHVAEAGDIVLIAPGQAHSCNPVGGQGRSYRMAHIDSTWFSLYVGKALNMENGLSVCKPVVRDATLFAEAGALVGAAVAGRAGVSRSLSAWFILMQRLHGCFSSAAKPKGGGVSSFFASPGQEQLVEAHSPVAALAGAAGMRRESFSRSFRRAAGLPPSCYLHCLRLEQGRQMLREGKSIAEAAAASGYADQSHFHRMFVKYFSVTPGCYRKNRSHPYKK